ncbi:MAG: HAMP domain-containing sensor histidine kinase [Mucinivorans sp.]
MLHNWDKIIVAILFTFCIGTARASIGNEVLIIDSYGVDYQWSSSIIDGIKSTLSDNFSGLGLNIEYLSTERFNDPAVWVDRINMVLSNYTSTMPAAIVLISDEAWMSYRAADNARFKDVPLFLCAVKPHSLDLVKYTTKLTSLTLDDFTPTKTEMQQYNAKAVLRVLNIDGYIRLITNTIKNLDRYAIITDNRFYGIYTRLLLEQHFKKTMQPYPVEYLDARFITTDTLLSRLNDITPSTGVLLTSWLTGQIGYEYSKNYIYNRMSSVIKTPIFITNDIGLSSDNFLGGYYFDALFWGEQTGEQIMNRLKWHSSSNNKSIKESQCNVNWEVLEKFNISKTLLPKDTVYINKRQSIWAEYYRELIIAGVILVLLAMNYAYVLRGNIRLKRAQKIAQQSIVEASRANANLIQTQEHLKIALVKAEAADRLKSSFISNMDHEIRTPLNAIVGFSSLITTMEDKEDIEMAALQIAENSEILLKIVRGIIDVSQLEAGTAEFNYQKVNLSWLFDDLIQICNAKCRAGVSVKFCHPEKPISMITEPTRVLQVLSNLAENAIKFTYNGTIELGYFQYDEQWIEFYVRDTGIGMHKEEVDKIFERFYKSDMYVQGTGLGLSIAKQIVETLAGKWGVESVFGVGSRFWFRLKKYNNK